MPLNLRPFQREDYARLACVNDALLAHEQGLGKSWAAFLIPMTWLGVKITDCIEPQGTILIVVPGDLKSQMADPERRSAATLMGQIVVPLDSQRTFLSLAVNGKLPNGFYLSS